MSVPAGMVRDEAHLRTLPDGTIISWLRIPGDRTSEAVAFVRREVEDGKVTVWISPGGWSPHSIAEAGVSFPATVVRLGEFQVDQYLGAELPVLSETLGEITEFGGGTYARDKALECAARIYAGRGFTSDGRAREMGELVTSLAAVFELWLDRQDEPDGDDGEPWPGDVLPANPDAALAAYAAWEDRDLATIGEPTAIVRADQERGL